MIVYLDSQDFSNLAKPPAGKEQFFTSLMGELTKLVDDGTIEIRYSAIHVSEMAHTSSNASKFSIPRMQIVRSLCRGKCMRFWMQIALDELAQHFFETPFVPTNDSDQWVDFRDNEFFGFAEQVHKTMQESLVEKGANRKQRRKAQAFDVVKFFTQTPVGLRAVEDLVGLFNEKFAPREPVNLEKFVGYISGSISRNEFGRYLKSIAFDPATLILRATEHPDLEAQIPSLVRSLSKDLVNYMNPQMTTVRTKIQSAPRGKGTEAIWDIIHSIPKILAMAGRRGMLNSALGDERWNKSKLPTLTDAEKDTLPCPTLDVLALGLEGFVKQVVAAAEKGGPNRPFASSDTADLFHATYIPYVDIFRCDTGWADTFKRAGKGYGTGIVGRIEDLLPAIHARAAAASALKQLQFNP